MIRFERGENRSHKKYWCMQKSTVYLFSMLQLVNIFQHSLYVLGQCPQIFLAFLHYVCNAIQRHPIQGLHRLSQHRNVRGFEPPTASLWRSRRCRSHDTVGRKSSKHVIFWQGEKYLTSASANTWIPLVVLTTPYSRLKCLRRPGKLWT